MEDYGSMNVVDLLDCYEILIKRLECAEPKAEDLEVLAEINGQISARLSLLQQADGPAYVQHATNFARLLERGGLERMASARENQHMFS